MQSRWSSKTFPVLILVLSLIVLFIQSCSLSQSNDPNLAPTLTLAALDSVSCPQVTPIVFPVAKKPKVIYVLIDRSGSYGLYTKRAMDVLIEGLEHSIGSGDRLYLIWLGANENPANPSLPDDPLLPDKYLLVETVPEISIPSLTPPIPTFIPTLTPEPTLTSTFVPTPYKTYGVLEKQSLMETATAVYRQLTITANASSVVATNIAIQVENNINQQQCDQAVINNQNLKLIKSWQKRREQIVEDFIEQTFEPLKDMSPQANDDATHIYNSLFYAARTIRDEKDTNLFGAYYLIILSDMQDVGSQGGKDLLVDLTNINVLMAMVSCNPSIECQNRGNYWEQYFRDHGAILPTIPFRLVDETTPYVISDFFQITGGSK